jgi:DNA polymerase III sliding clamp (beta) subunit (PCNA family)
METLTVDAPVDDQLATGINGTYMGQALATIAGQTATLHFTDDLSPIHVTGDDAHACRHVIMPMRI